MLYIALPIRRGRPEAVPSLRSSAPPRYLPSEEDARTTTKVLLSICTQELSYAVGIAAVHTFDCLERRKKVPIFDWNQDAQLAHFFLA